MALTRPGYDKKGVYDGNWGLASGELKTASAGQLFRRGMGFAVGGSGYKREALANSFGLLSKQQATQKGIMAAFQRKLVPGFGLFTAFDMASRNQGISDYTTQALALTGASVGFRFSQNIGLAQGKIMRLKGWKLSAFGGLRGIIGGIGGAALLGGAAYVASEFTNSNNFINQAAGNLRSADFVSKFTETNLTTTNRQRALEKISKSALNNRGQILGNEASVLNGLI